MRMAVRRAGLLAGVAVAAASVAVAPAAVASPDRGTPRPKPPKTVRVQGEQIPVDLSAGRYVMTGDLVGDWLYEPRTPPLHDAETLYVEAGTEIFDGCIDRNHDGRCGPRDRTGQMHLAFIYWASYDADRNLIKGQCVHPVTGGNGAFRGARGRLDMVDTPVGDEVRTTYRGTIVLRAVPTEDPTEPVTLPPVMASSARATSGPRRC